MRITVPSRRVAALATVTAVVMGVLLVAAGNSDAFGAAAGTAYSPCLPGTSPAVVSYTAGDLAGSHPALDAIHISGLSGAGCAGSTVVVTISGNPAGDPAQPATELLGTYDSGRDACTQQPLADPLIVSGGAITVTGCATGPASYAALHDATRIELQVHGRTLPARVLGETITRGGTRTSAGRAVADGATLPFTGTYAALTIWVGVLLLAAGIVLYVAGRRRRTG